MKDKKWLYSGEMEYNFWSKQIETYYNIPYFRSPKNYKCIMKIMAYIDELSQEYKIKRISKEILRNYDAFEDIRVAAHDERKSWKRNSKRKHQYKY